MTNLQRLKAEARGAARFRGHTLTPWRPDSYWPTVQNAQCTCCGRGARIDTNPPPNGVDISGEAVALNCERADHEKQ